MSQRPELSEAIHRMLPGEQWKRVRQAILEAASYSGLRTDQLRQAIDQSNRLKTGRLVKGNIEFSSEIESQLSGYVWVINFTIHQPTGTATLAVEAPHPTIERTDVFTGNAAGVISYYPGMIDSLGNSFFPTISTDEVILEIVTRNPDNTNTVDPGTVGAADWISKSATALQLMAGPLGIVPLAGTIQDLIGTDPNGLLRKVPASRAGVYTTLEGDGGFTSGWSKILRITIDPALQINYVITFQILGVTPTYEKGDMWVIFRVDGSGDIILNSLKLFGEFTPERYTLIKVDATHYELYVSHDQVDSLYSFRPIMLFGNDWRYEFFQQSPIVENVPAGTQYGFDLFGGLDGRDPEFQNNGTHIQWRLVGDMDWIDLIDLSSIGGGGSGPTDYTPSTGNVKFDEARSYGYNGTPVTGNINIDITGAKEINMAKVLHQSGTVPSVSVIGSGVTLHLSGGTYNTAKVNELLFICHKNNAGAVTRISYSISPNQL